MKPVKTQPQEQQIIFYNSVLSMLRISLKPAKTFCPEQQIITRAADSPHDILQLCFVNVAEFCEAVGNTCPGAEDVLRVVGNDGVGSLLATHHAHHLAAKLLPRGAVQEEVDGVVEVHEHLGHGEDELELAHAGQVVRLAVPKGRSNDADVHGKGGEEEGEGHSQQHHRQPDVAVAGKAPVALIPSSSSSSSAARHRAGGSPAKVSADFPVSLRPGHHQTLQSNRLVVVVAATGGSAVASAAVAAAAADVAAVDAAVAAAAGEVDELVLAAALAAALLDGALEGAAVLQDDPAARRPHDVNDDKYVEDEDDDERSEPVEKGIHPGPDGGDEKLVALLTVALRAVPLAAAGHLPRDVGRPQEVQVDEDENGRQGQNHALGSSHVAHLSVTQ